MTLPDHSIIIERLTRMEEKQDHLLEKLDGNHNRLDGHEVRIRGLETSGSKYVGMAVAFAAIASLAAPRIIQALAGGAV